jgi:hypothetical protein
VHSMRPSEHSDVKCERKPTDGTRDITMLAWVPINTNRNRFHNNDSATGKAHRLRCGGGHARMGVQPTCGKAEERRRRGEGASCAKKRSYLEDLHAGRDVARRLNVGLERRHLVGELGGNPKCLPCKPSVVLAVDDRTLQTTDAGGMCVYVCVRQHAARSHPQGQHAGAGTHVAQRGMSDAAWFGAHTLQRNSTMQVPPSLHLGCGLATRGHEYPALAKTPTRQVHSARRKLTSKWSYNT